MEVWQKAGALQWGHLRCLVASPQVAKAAEHTCGTRYSMGTTFI